MWHVYILECNDKTFYTGITNDVTRRLKEHNASKGGAYTRSRTPVRLVFKEPHPDMSSALKEKLKSKNFTDLKSQL